MLARCRAPFHAKKRGLEAPGSPAFSFGKRGHRRNIAGLPDGGLATIRRRPESERLEPTLVQRTGWRPVEDVWRHDISGRHIDELPYASGLTPEMFSLRMPMNIEEPETKLPA